MADGRPIYLYIDLNSYFATAEQQANPILRGKPVGVCEHSGGIILAASYEAKKFGIKTGTPVWEAKKICPQIVLLPVNPGRIRALTSRFYGIAEEYSDYVEHISVDEVSVDLTNVCFSWNEALESALEIKAKMKKEMGEWITASIGVAESRMLAKIGTDRQKPDGLVLIVKDKSKLNLSEDLADKVRCFNISELYDILDLQDIPGIGSRLKRSLFHHGITSLKALSQVPVETLHSWYGITGVWLHDMGNFRDAWRHVDLDDRGVKSIGHQYALGKRKALYEKDKVLGLFWKLTERVTARLRQQEMFASAVSVYFAYAKGGSIGGSHRTKDLFDDSPTAAKVAEIWTKEIDFKKGVSFMAVSVSGLSKGGRQGMLFEKDRLRKEVPQALDKINERHGDFSIMYGPTLEVFDLAGDTVGFGRTRERLNWEEE